MWTLELSYQGLNLRSAIYCELGQVLKPFCASVLICKVTMLIVPTSYRLNEIIHVKCLEWLFAHSKHAVLNIVMVVRHGSFFCRFYSLVTKTRLKLNK